MLLSQEHVGCLSTEMEVCEPVMDKISLYTKKYRDRSEYLIYDMDEHLTKTIEYGEELYENWLDKELNYLNVDVSMRILLIEK